MLKASYIIKRLNNSHEEKILAHFARLDSESLYNRFCYTISPDSLKTYVSKIDFKKDGVFGIFDDNLNIIGVGECVLDEKSNRAEVGFSVEINHQGQGLGGKLLQRIVRFAKAREKTHLEMLCLRTNQKSQHLAKKFGLKVQHECDGESLGIIDMKGAKPEVEEMNESIEDTMAYYALRQKENFKSWESTRNFYSEMYAQLCFGAIKMLAHSPKR